MSKVLLIEPDTTLAALYKTALKTKKHTVTVIHDAQSALLILDRKAFDVIILEPDMPDHNGLEFLYEFCSYDDWVSMPVIIHSSLPSERYGNMLVRWSELGVTDYLYKPETSLEALQQAVRSIAAAKV